MDNRALGVFDSGIGGLTAVKEMIHLMPNEDIIYFGDTARVPYGSRDAETLRAFAQQDMEFLLSRHVKAILIACGTVSSTALSILQKHSTVPVIGVIQAAAKTAAKSGNRIGVLGTQATITSHAFRDAIQNENPKCKIIEKACPLFVPLIENGYIDKPATKLIVEDYLRDLVAFGVDTVILGCTHYPLLNNFIQEVLPTAKIIEAGKEAVYELQQVIHEKDIGTNTDHRGNRKFYVSEMTKTFQSVCETFLDETTEGKIELFRF